MDPELFQRMQEAAARFKSGESDFEEIITPAGLAHLVRDPDDPRGFRIDFVGHGAKRSVPVQEYPAASSRPPGYPAPLPFLPNCTALVNTLDQVVAWVDPEKPKEAFAHLVREMVEDGWTLGTSLGESQVLEKEVGRRTLRLGEEHGLPRIVLELER